MAILSTLVPTLRVGTQWATALRSLVSTAAERPTMHSHAERGSEVTQRMLARTNWGRGDLEACRLRISTNCSRRTPTTPLLEQTGGYFLVLIVYK